MKTIKIRIKDSNIGKKLTEKARAVNYVWNYCNQASIDHVDKYNKWLTGFDLQKLTSGASKELKLSSTTIQVVSEELYLRRKQFKKKKLRWRSNKKSLGWIPFKKAVISIKNGVIKYLDLSIKTFQPERLVGIEHATGSFVEDSRGRWYVCLAVESAVLANSSTTSVGIDLGIKDVATCSDGTKIKNHKFVNKYARRLARAQRNKKTKLVKTLHAKVANSRLDHLHKESTKIVSKNKLVVVGDLKISKIAKTRMAKSMLDAGAGMFSQMLEYKASTHQCLFVRVNESNTTRTCSSCGVIPSSSPKGLKGLRVREWICCECGTVHDRDINASKNILRLGHQSLSAKSA